MEAADITNITFVNCLIAFLGMVLFFLIRYRNRQNKKTPFNFSFWIKDNLSELLISLITSAACFLMLDDLAVYLNKFVSAEIPMIKITAFLCGYANQWILKLITAPFKKKQQTN